MEKIKKTESTAATSQPPSTITGKTEANPLRYVVVREGHRVSEREYETPTDPECVSECCFYRNIARNFSHNEKVEIVQYDHGKHRIW